MELLIIADPNDALAEAFARAARHRGVNAFRLELIEAARLFTIHRRGTHAHVEPAVPCLLRPAIQPPGLSDDESFSFKEAFAAVWAATALSSAPVINRPTSLGFAAASTSSGALTEERALMRPPWPESFARHAPGPFDGVESWLVEDLGTRDTSVWPALPVGIGPYRARPGLVDEQYECVAVLGDGAWCASGRSDLAPLSAQAVTGLGLSFACVVWAVSAAGAVRLARVEPFPSLARVGFAWDMLADALLDRLRS